MRKALSKLRRRSRKSSPDTPGAAGDQSQSPLFRILPPELRCQIWALAIGTPRVLLTTKSGRRLRAKEAPEAMDYLSWSEYIIPNVVLLCRESYVEAIPIFYDQTTFCFAYRGLTTIYSFEEADELVPRTLVSLIRRLEIGVWPTTGILQRCDVMSDESDLFKNVTSEPDSWDKWRRTISKINALPSLRALTVVVWRLPPDGQTERADKQKSLLAPLEELSHPEHIEVSLPWSPIKPVSDGEWEEETSSRIDRKYKHRQEVGVYAPVASHVPPFPPPQSVRLMDQDWDWRLGD